MEAHTTRPGVGEGSTHHPPAQVWEMCHQAHLFLAEGYTTMTMKAGQFQFSYRMWLEDSEVLPPPHTHTHFHITLLESGHTMCMHACVHACVRACVRVCACVCV